VLVKVGVVVIVIVVVVVVGEDAEDMEDMEDASVVFGLDVVLNRKKNRVCVCVCVWKGREFRVCCCGGTRSWPSECNLPPSEAVSPLPVPSPEPFSLENPRKKQTTTIYPPSTHNLPPPPKANMMHIGLPFKPLPPNVPTRGIG